MILTPDELHTIEVLPQPPETLWQRLDAAITQAQGHGAVASTGVLVRRLEWGLFRVSVSSLVPRGRTYEADDWAGRVDTRTSPRKHALEETVAGQPAGIGHTRGPRRNP